MVDWNVELPEPAVLGRPTHVEDTNQIIEAVEELREHAETSLRPIVEVVESGALGRVHHVLIEDSEIISVPDEQVATLILEQGEPGGHEASWPSGILWDREVPPDLGTLPGQIDMVTFVRAGNHTLGMHTGSFMVPLQEPVISLYSSTDTTALIEWEPVPNASAYQIRINGGTPEHTIDEYHQFVGLTPGTENTVEVRAETATGYTPWGSLTFSAKDEMVPVFFEDFDAPDDTAVDGRVVDDVTLSSPGVDLAYVEPTDPFLIQDGKISTITGNSERKTFSWPVSSQNVRISVDYAIEQGSSARLFLMLGNSRSENVGVLLYANSRWEFRVDGQTVKSSLNTTHSARVTLQVEGKYMTHLVNGELNLIMEIPERDLNHAALAMWRGAVEADNLEVTST